MRFFGGGGWWAVWDGAEPAGEGVEAIASILAAQCPSTAGFNLTWPEYADPFGKAGFHSESAISIHWDLGPDLLDHSLGYVCDRVSFAIFDLCDHAPPRIDDQAVAIGAPKALVIVRPH